MLLNRIPGAWLLKRIARKTAAAILRFGQYVGIQQSPYGPVRPCRHERRKAMSDERRAARRRRRKAARKPGVPQFTRVACRP